MYSIKEGENARKKRESAAQFFYIYIKIMLRSYFNLKESVAVGRCAAKICRFYSLKREREQGVRGRQGPFTATYYTM